MSSAARQPATETTLGCTRSDVPVSSEVDRDAADIRAIPVTAVHGFAQTLGCLGPLGDALGRRGTVTLVDAPGHASSERHREADLELGASLLAATARGGVLLGYSMGARLALQSALDHPSGLRGLVLVSGTAGIDDPAERADRAAVDHARAAHLEAVGVEAFVREWLAMDMFAGLAEWARFEHERARNSVRGLAASLRRAGTGSMAPLWDRLGELEVPLLCVSGERDVRYGELADRLVERVGDAARHVRLAGAGHAAHLEQPGACTAAVESFLGRLESSRVGDGDAHDQAPTNNPNASPAP